MGNVDQITQFELGAAVDTWDDQSLPFVNCGRCAFVAHGRNESLNYSMFIQHECVKPTSPWTWLAVGAVTLAMITASVLLVSLL